MNWTEKIYWLTRLDNLQSLFVWILAIGIIFIAVTQIIRFVNYIEGYELYKPKTWQTVVFILLIIIGSLGITFTPTTKEAIFIVAGGKTLDHLSSDTSLNKIPGQVTTIVSTWLDKKLNELESDVKNQVEELNKK